MGGKKDTSLCDIFLFRKVLASDGLIRVNCLRPSKAEDGLCCRLVQLFHCYWSVENPRNHHRRILQGGWFLARGGPKFCGVQSHAGEGYHQLCYHPATGYLGKNRIKQKHFYSSQTFSNIVNTITIIFTAR